LVVYNKCEWSNSYAGKTSVGGYLICMKKLFVNLNHFKLINASKMMSIKLFEIKFKLLRA